MSLLATIKAKREERKKLLDQAGEIITKAQASESKRMTPEQEQEFDKRHADGDVLLKEIERLERQLHAERSLEQTPHDPRQAGKEDRTADDEDKPKLDPEHRKEIESLTFRAWMSGGPNALNVDQRAIYQKRLSQLPPELRSLSAVTGSAGGFTVPTGFENSLDVALKAYGGMPEAATILPTDSGNVIPYPTMNDTNNTGALLAENSPIATDVDPSFGVVNLNAYMFTSRTILVPIQLLEDSAFNIEGYLVEAISTRIGRIINTLCTNGTGNAQPQGIIPASSLGKTTAGAAAITYNEIVDLQHSVDPLYRTGAKFMFHDNTLLYLRKLADSTGRPLWIAGGVSEGPLHGPPDTFAGYPYIINQDMDNTIATGKKTILFGQLSKYVMRRVRGVNLVRFGEKYMDRLQIGVMAYHRADGALIDAGAKPVKYLQQA